jgi:hypothetical protein
MSQPNSSSSAKGDARVSHPKTSVVIVLTLGLIVLTVILMNDPPHRAYAPLKWMLSLGLIYCAGYFLLPRRKLLVQHPDNAGEAVVLNYKSSLSEDGARQAGWIEIDRLAGTAVKCSGNTTVPIADTRIQRISEETGNFPPISQSVAAIHVLAAILLCPLAGIKMSKDNWLMADFLLACYLVCTLIKISKEKNNPKCALLWLDHEGEPRYTDSHRRSIVGERAIKLWAMIVVLALVIAFISLNDSGVFYRSDFELPLVEATALAAVVSLFVTGFVFWLIELSWKCSPPIEILLAVGFAIFLLVINSQITRNIFENY